MSSHLISIYTEASARILATSAENLTLVPKAVLSRPMELLQLLLRFQVLLFIIFTFFFQNTIHSTCSESECRSVVSDSLRPHGLYSSWNSPSQNTGVGSLSFLQGIFPTQGSNPGLPHCRQILYQRSHKGSPKQDYIKCTYVFLLRVEQRIISGHLGSHLESKPTLSLSMCASSGL